MISPFSRKSLRRCGTLLRAPLVLVTLLSLPSCEQQGAGGDAEHTRTQSARPIDAATRTQVVTDVAAVIRDNYADREVGDALADSLLANHEGGRYDSIGVAEMLLGEVMALIRARVADRHFELRPSGDDDDQSHASSSRIRSRHGLRTVRMLQHQVAYLEFDNLPGDTVSLGYVEEALATLPDRQALILDIRDNNGGSGDMVVQLCNHLLAEGTILYKFSNRSGRPPGEVRATPSARHFGPTLPVYILTSEDTMSAAEALAFILQDYQRATVVGQSTAGMANPSRTFPIGNGFELTVPFLLISYGRSGDTFAGRGVAPDIASPADRALDVAMAEIRTRLGADAQRE